MTQPGAEITSSSHIGNKNPFRYRGYFYDTETGLYYLQTRYYDPEIGRFISRDSIEYADPETINGLNLYAYCGNNPVMNVDPTGHSVLWILALIFIAVVGVTGGTVKAVETSKQEGATAGDIALSFFTGLFAGVAVGGAVVAVGGVVGFLCGGIAGLKIAAIGAAAVNLGFFVWGALTGIETPDPIEFPSRPVVPILPTPITGFANRMSPNCPTTNNILLRNKRIVRQQITNF